MKSPEPSLETLRLVVPPDALEIYEAALLGVCPTVGFFREDDDGRGRWKR